MSILDDLDAELQKDLLAFVESERENKKHKPLHKSLTAELLKQLVNGDREMTGLATDGKTGDVFARFSFTKERSNKL